MLKTLTPMNSVNFLVNTEGVDRIKVLRLPGGRLENGRDAASMHDYLIKS